jgi:hypothetical protein
MRRTWRAERRRLLMVVLTAASLITTAVTLGSASAANGFRIPKIYTYKATFVGRGSYTEKYYAPPGPGAGGPTTETIKADFDWNVEYPSLLIFGSTGSGLASKKDSDFDGQWNVDISNPGGGSCSDSGELAAPEGASGPGTVRAHKVLAGLYGVTFQPISGTPVEKPAGKDDCSDIGGPEPSDFWQDWPADRGVATSDRYTASGSAPFRAVVRLEPKKEGRVFELVRVGEDELPDDDCGSTPSLGITCTVKYSWTGSITFKRKSVKSL